jgi:hypothetical protein
VTGYGVRDGAEETVVIFVERHQRVIYF